MSKMEKTDFCPDKANSADAKNQRLVSNVLRSLSRRTARLRTIRIVSVDPCRRTMRIETDAALLIRDIVS